MRYRIYDTDDYIPHTLKSYKVADEVFDDSAEYAYKRLTKDERKEIFLHNRAIKKQVDKEIENYNKTLKKILEDEKALLSLRFKTK